VSSFHRPIYSSQWNYYQIHSRQILDVWYILSLCTNVSKVQEEEAKEGSKPQVLVVGFANLIWSLYLMFLVSGFGPLFIVNQQVGQTITSSSLISILSSVEISNTLKSHHLNLTKVKWI
ncbi:hypothetical protein PSTT_10216, partial [Puccinia striiformis]